MARARRRAASSVSISGILQKLLSEQYCCF
jgi:hypothetical protein